MMESPEVKPAHRPEVAAARRRHRLRVLAMVTTTMVTLAVGVACTSGTGSPGPTPVSESVSSSVPGQVSVEDLVGMWRLVAIDGDAMAPGEDDQGRAIGVRISREEAGQIKFVFNSYCNTTSGSGAVATDGTFSVIDAWTTLVACDDPFHANLLKITEATHFRLVDNATRLQVLREDNVLAEYIRLN
jgi:hypothetical protein